MASSRKGDRTRYPLPDPVDDGSRICVKLYIPNIDGHRQALIGAIYNLTRWYSWAQDDAKTGREVAAVWQPIFYDMMDTFYDGCPDDNRCFEFPPSAAFIEWFPNNPYTEPDLVTEGYNAPAWYQATEASHLILGTQTGDVVTDLSRFPPGSLPSIIPASGLPRFRINLGAPGIVTIHLLNIFAGSLAQITIDDDPLTVRFIDMNRDQIAAPFETATTTPVEVEVLGAGAHHIDVIVVSQINDQIPFLHHGGGLRKVEICGEAADMPYFELRQDPEDPCLVQQRLTATGEWIEAFRMDNCCDDNPVGQRYNDDGILEVTYDGETWEEDRQSDPRFNSPVFPPLDGADGADKRCAAAASVVETLKIDIVEKMEAGQASNELLAIILAALALFLSGGAAAPLVMVMIFEVINFGIAATQAAFTSGVWDQFKCIVYCNMNDDASFSEDQWKRVWRDSFAEFSDSIVQTFLGNTIKAFGPVGLTNAARSGRVATADCSECDCEEDWCYEWLGLDQSPDWAMATGQPFGNYGYLYTEGWGTSQIGGVFGTRPDGYSAMIIQANMASTNITSVEVWTTGGAPTLRRVGRPDVYSGFVNMSFVGDHWAVTGSWTVTQLRIFFECASLNNPCKLTKIRLSGLGANPFGEDNCV